MYALTTSSALLVATAMTATFAQADVRGQAAANEELPVTAALSAPQKEARAASVGQSTTAIRIVTTDAAAAAKLVAETHGLNVQVSDAVQGRLSNLILTGNVDHMMSLISTETQVEWFVYSGTLEVSARNEGVTRFIQTGELSAEAIDKALATSELNAELLNLLHMPDSSAVRVTGPPRAVEIVEAVLSLAEEDAPVVVKDAIIVRRGTTTSVETYGSAAITDITNSPPPEQSAPDIEADAEVEAKENAEQSDDES